MGVIPANPGLDFRVQLAENRNSVKRGKEPSVRNGSVEMAQIAVFGFSSKRETGPRYHLEGSLVNHRTAGCAVCSPSRKTGFQGKHLFLGKVVKRILVIHDSDAIVGIHESGEFVEDLLSGIDEFQGFVEVQDFEVIAV
jgi:hypothetical protein